MCIRDRQCVEQHSVEIQVNGQPLTGSPRVVQVIPHRYQFAFQFGSKGNEQGQFDEPFYIVVNDKTRRVAIVDRNERSQIFNFEGKLLNEKPSFCVVTTSDDEFFFGIEDDGKFYLCTENGQRIRSFNLAPENGYDIFESDGRAIAHFNEDEGTIEVIAPDVKHVHLSFRAPNCNAEQGWVLYHQDKFFISYPDAHHIRVFNNAGVHLYDIGEEGSGDAQLMRPFGLVIDKFNHLIVCDVLNERLQVFTLDGKFVAKITGSFFNDSCLTACAASNTGYLFATDGDRNCVYVFN